MINTSRSRQKMEGWIGRRRTYRCRQCNLKFQVDTLNPLPIKDRICPECKDYAYLFVDKDGREVEVRANSAELATLRAWKINPELRFKE